MGEIISYCGIRCDECPVYVATKNGDEAKKQQLALDYSIEICKFEASDMNCYGCFDVKNKDTKMCGDCEIRNCAISKNIENCGHCENYYCDIISRRIPEGSNERKRLDEINNKVFEK